MEDYMIRSFIVVVIFLFYSNAALAHDAGGTIPVTKEKWEKLSKPLTGMIVSYRKFFPDLNVVCRYSKKFTTWKGKKKQRGVFEIFWGEEVRIVYGEPDGHQRADNVLIQGYTSRCGHPPHDE